MRKLWMRTRRAVHGERGITGLETAIILIAFVVVASVFAYTVLSAGIFSSQKSSESVYSGLDEAQSSIEIKGGVIALDAGGTADLVDSMTFTVGIPSGGDSIDFTNPTVSGSNDGLALEGASATNRVVINIYNGSVSAENIYWTTTRVGQGDSDNMLDDGEKFQITLGGAVATNALEQCLSTSTLSANETFTIQLVPPTGSALIIERTLPGVIDDVMDLN